MLISLGRILPAKIKQFGLEKEIEFKNLEKKWGEIVSDSVGNKFKSKSKPLKLKNKFLTVRCLNSIWANELQIKESLVLKILKKKFKNLAVERIKFLS